MKSSILIGQELYIGSKAFRQGSKIKTKSNCDLAYMVCFWRENQLVPTKKTAYRRAHSLENQSVH
jgi:hypothetical protein